CGCIRGCRLLLAVPPAARAAARLLLRRTRTVTVVVFSERPIRDVDHRPGRLRLPVGRLVGGLVGGLVGRRDRRAAVHGDGCGLLLAVAAAARTAPRLLLRRRGSLVALLVVELDLDLALLELRLVDRHLFGLRRPAHGRLAGARRALRLRLGGERLVELGDRSDELGPGKRVRDDGHARLHAAADELRGVRDDDVDVADLADSCVWVVQAHLAELHVDLLADVDAERRSNFLERPLVEHAEVVEVLVFLRDEEEAAFRRLLELAQSRPARADEEPRDLRRDLDAKRLRARPRGDETAQAALDVDGGGVLGDDDPVAPARRALLRHDLARPVGDVLARHLDEAERRDLHDVRLRAVAFELFAERLLDGSAVLGARHVDEVDDDDAADVAQPQLTHDLFHRLEVVLRDRVLEPSARLLRARADEAAGVHVDDGECLGVVEDQIAARRQVDAAIERRADLLLDAERLHQRLALLVARDALRHVR